MAHEMEFDIHGVDLSEESAQKMLDMPAGKGATQHTEPVLQLNVCCGRGAPVILGR